MAKEEWNARVMPCPLVMNNIQINLAETTGNRYEIVFYESDAEIEGNGHCFARIKNIKRQSIGIDNQRIVKYLAKDK